MHVPYLSRRPRALLLDAGNTIVFLDHNIVSEHLHAAGWTITTEALGASLVQANHAYADILNKGAGHEDGWREFMARWIMLAGVPEEDSAEAVTILRRHHDELNLWRKVPEGVPEALQQARDAGILLAIISNSEGRLVPLLEHLGIVHLFDTILDSGIEGVRKPDPEIFRRALKRLSVEPHECVYAGDIPEVDIDGPRAVGIQPVLVDALCLYPTYTAAPRYDSVVMLCADLVEADQNMTRHTVGTYTPASDE